MLNFSFTHGFFFTFLVFFLCQTCLQNQLPSRLALKRKLEDPENPSSKRRKVIKAEEPESETNSSVARISVNVEI